MSAAAADDNGWRAKLIPGSAVQLYCPKDQKWHRGVVATGYMNDVVLAFDGWSSSFNVTLPRHSPRMRPVDYSAEGWRFALTTGSRVYVRQSGSWTAARVSDCVNDAVVVDARDQRLTLLRDSEHLLPHSDMSSDVTPSAAAASAAAPTSATTTTVGSGAGNPIVVVAIDLGTSRSGTAYALFNRPGDIHCEQQSGGIGMGAKVPTCILLRASDLSFVAFGDAAREQYSQMELDEKERSQYRYFDRFKMALYPGAGRSLQTEPELRSACGQMVPARRVFTAALRHLKERAMERLQTASLNRLQSADVLFVLTVPALWSQGAKELMRDAAIEAGIADRETTPNGRRCVLALESEAAAICCRARQLAAMDAVAGTDRVAATFGPGTSFAVIDNGGGTSDFTVHKLLANGTVGEECMSSGGDWGSTQVDANLVRLLGRLLGGAHIVDEFRAKSPLDYLQLLADFETLKMTVKSAAPAGGKMHRLRLPLTLVATAGLHTTKFGQTVHLTTTPAKNAAAVAVAAPATSTPADGKSIASSVAPPTSAVAAAASTSTVAAPNLGVVNIHASAGASGPSISPAPDGKEQSSCGGEASKHGIGSRPATPSGFETEWEVLTSGAPPPEATVSAAAINPPPALAAAAASSVSAAAAGVSASAASAAPASVVAVPPVVSVAATASAAGGSQDGKVGVVSAMYRDLILHLDHPTILSLYDEPIAAIVGELRKVLVRVPTLSHVFLVGGFSDSDPVRVAVQAELEAHASLHDGKSIVLVRPPHPSLAVLTGAVMYGLRPSIVQARHVKKTYGVAVSCEWHPKKHADRLKNFRPNNGRMVAFCDGIFSPFCLAGDKVDVDSVVSQIYQPGEDAQECMVLRVYESDSRVVSYIDAADARRTGTFTLSMPNQSGNLERRVQMSMRFGTTEIEVSATDLTSGSRCKARLCCLDSALDRPSWAPDSSS